MPENQSEEPIAPPPTFDVLPLSQGLRQAVDELGYTHPTPVQRAVFEPASRSRDLVVQARTGTGKTAAFGLPIIDTLIKKNEPVVQALILCPTRELALQVTRELTALAKHKDTQCVAVYGGAPMGKQIEQIRAGAQIVVGTPGRVLDHLSRGTIDPEHIHILVLDESDEMLSMGFLPQITDILSYLPEQRQTLLFSATLPPAISRMAETRLREPEFITLSGDQVGALEIDHFVYLTFSDKLGDLVRIIEVEDPESAIIFCNTRDETKRVSAALKQEGYEVDWLNADLAQNEREKVMAATRNSQLRFLVATDVAARGIDISHLTHVINYDFPESTEQYVHRTGRTGRAGRTGTAISLITPANVGNLYMLRLTYKIEPVEKQLPSTREMKTRAETDLVQMFSDLFSKRRVHPDDLNLARRLLTHENAEQVVAGLLRDHLGARPDAREEATAARRARPPRPAEAATPEPSERGPRDAEGEADGRSRRRRDRGRDESRSGGRRDEREASRGGERSRDESRSSGRRDEPGEPRKADEAPRRSRRAQGDEADSKREPRRRDESRSGGRGDQPRDERAPRRARAGSEAPRVEEDEFEFGYTVSDMDRADSEPPPDSDEHGEVYVNVGKRDGAKERDLIEALEERAGVTSNDTSYVHVRNRHSFVGVRRELVDKVVDALNGAIIAGKEATAEPARPRA